MPTPHATHPSATDLAAFAAGRLTGAGAQDVAAHLKGCPACRRVVAEAREAAEARTLNTVAGLRPDAPVSGGTLVQGAAAPPPAAAPGSTEQPAPLPPELANHPRYRIIKELGRGGMGVVYQAEQTLMDRRVAIKVITKALLEQPGALERFQREVRAAAKLAHPNIVIAYDAERAGDLHMLVMEYVEGQSLDQVLRRKGPLPIINACHYVRQAALGLQHAFERGMVHRDIKPQNLMLTPKGQIKILDFGLAKVASEQNRAGAEFTVQGTYMGTPDYSAPEQATDARSADIRADIYSLGCTLYCLLAGKPPFQGGSDIQTILAHLEKPPQPLPELRADVSPELWAVVARMLAKDPAQRYQKPAELAQALAPFCKPGSKGSIPDLAPVATPGRATPAPHDTKALAGVARGGVEVLEETDILPAAAPPRSAPAATGRGGMRWVLLGGVAVAALALIAVAVVGLVVIGAVLTPRATQQVAAATGDTADGGKRVSDGFVPLFNGKDLKGWRTHQGQRGKWEVKDGVLIGSGPQDSYLYTDEDDFADFELRGEARINDGGNSGIFFRAGFGPTLPPRSPRRPSGYEAQINSTHAELERAGSLFAHPGGAVATVTDQLVAPGQWFTLDILAQGDHIVIKVNGKQTANWTDPAARHTHGTIALEHLDPKTVVEFRNIEVKKLPQQPPKPVGGHGGGKPG